MKITYNNNLFTELASIEIDLYGKHELRHYFKIYKSTRVGNGELLERYYLRLYDNQLKLLKDMGYSDDLKEVESWLEDALNSNVKYFQKLLT